MFKITGDIVLPDRVLPGGTLAINDAGWLGEVGLQPATLPKSGDISALGFLVLPGFIDMHVHGGGGADFMHGTPDAVRQAVRTHARFGTTGLLATTLTASQNDTDRSIRAVRSVQESGRDPDESRIFGIHLEGPYLCPARRGAQPAAFIRLPDVEEFLQWVAVSEQSIRQITLAPEMAGAESVIRAAHEQGVIVSLGHTDAPAMTVEQAVGWGASQATHVFNAMSGIHHREPGVAGAALALPEVVVEVIADGIHLHPLIVRMIANAKSESGIVLITDAIEGAAMPDGDYQLGGRSVRVENGTAAFDDGTLAGSVLTMNRAFHNARSFAHLTASRAAAYASTNAARQLGLLETYGTLESGKQADIVIIDPKTSEVEWTIIGGKVAYKR